MTKSVLYRGLVPLLSELGIQGIGFSINLSRLWRLDFATPSP
jgi:hypothetical protein